MYAVENQPISLFTGEKHTKMQIPEHVSWIIHRLQQAGYEAYAVGGCVRDSLLGRKPEDWDITTSAKPEQVKALFLRTIDTGILHGTVTIMMDKTGYEVTTYRVDGEYEDGRHPKHVTFTASLIEDLKRRDFTINAMAYNEEEGIIDAFDGKGDLEKGLIRCVGVAEERFTEDALRMMRAVRFAGQLGFAIEKETENAIVKLASNLKKISAERVQTELVKLLISAHPQRLRTMYETGITAVVLPEFDKMMETEQKNPHHCYSVGEHTIRAMEMVEGDKVLRLTMLLHDVSKPECRTADEEGIDHFHGHPVKGADKAKEILRRLKFDNATIQKVCALVRYHDENPPLQENAVRRAIVRTGREQYPAIFEVKRADIKAQSTYKQQEKLAYVDAYEKIYQEILKKEQCLAIADLAVNGKDLIALGVKSGPALGKILKELFEVVLEEPEKNTRETLLAIALKVHKQNNMCQ